MSSPLQSACIRRHIDAVIYLLSIGATQEEVVFYMQNDWYPEERKQKVYEDSLFLVKLLMEHGIFPKIDNYCDTSYANDETLMSLLLKYYPEKAREESFLLAVAYWDGIRGLGMIKNRHADIIFPNKVVKRAVDYFYREDDGACDGGELCEFFGITLAECSMFFLDYAVGVSSVVLFRDMNKAKEIFGEIVLPMSAIRSVERSVATLLFGLIEDGHVKLADDSAKMAVEELKLRLKMMGLPSCKRCWGECLCFEPVYEIARKIRES